MFASLLYEHFKRSKYVKCIYFLFFINANFHSPEKKELRRNEYSICEKRRNNSLASAFIFALLQINLPRIHIYVFVHSILSISQFKRVNVFVCDTKKNDI